MSREIALYVFWIAAGAFAGIVMGEKLMSFLRCPVCEQTLFRGIACNGCRDRRRALKLLVPIALAMAALVCAVRWMEL